MRKRGVKFVSGIDSGMLYVRFDDIAYTPERMVEVVGMGNMEAIVACTKTSAECLQVDEETGTIDKNKSAEIYRFDDFNIYNSSKFIPHMTSHFFSFKNFSWILILSSRTMCSMGN